MATSADALRFELHGAERIHQACRAILPTIAEIFTHQSRHQAGTRLFDILDLRPLMEATGPVGAIAARVLGPGARCVRALAFDKTADMNWSLAWHQDRTIAVVERKPVDGFGPWTIKQGRHHVVPPIGLLERMVTIRVHLDDVPHTNAPLLIAPGSHRMGRIAEADISQVVRKLGTATCIADAGDAWLYATPILHASDAAAVPDRRRVLQADYAVGDLPGGLAWLGI